MLLKGKVFQISEVDESMLRSMYAVMYFHYENLKEENFYRDIGSKDKVLVLYDESNIIRGFTSVKLYDMEIQNQLVRLIYSGDTIIHKEYWGDFELPRVWINMVFSMKSPNRKNYWLLISKGYKTYRFLPAYFKEFYPRKHGSIPNFEKEIMDNWAVSIYGEAYDKEKGVIQMKGQKDYLRHDIAKITEHRLKNPDIEFFVTRNPGHVIGDELVCITALSMENLNSRGQRYIDGQGL